ncbi:MFS transporter [Actinacidiphila yeochonensis]|uniref:MFS transporter n=1 Tax=Actinacidiphila yeochonensis TaxID=89050 RepID=UPI00099D96EA|nr:MFS transporter [Actinacidiphila yeochonensis]
MAQLNSSAPPPAAAAAPSDTAAGTWSRMRLWGIAHAVDDLYQGLVPATVPYFVLDRHYGYVAASGLTLAATLGSSVPQPFLGVAVDRLRVGWLVGAGVALAGIGFGLSGLVPSYAATWCLIMLSGLGVAMFHPAAGKAAREAAGDSAAAMSVFAAGGSVGFFLAPVLATPALIAWGVGTTALFIPPAVLIAFVLLRHRRRQGAATVSAVRAGRDQWRPFAVLTSVEVVRSVAFFGVNTFIELYWIRDLHASRGLAGAALTCFLAGGVSGTLLGGRIADRLGMVRTVQIGGGLALPMLAGLVLTPGSVVPLLFAVLTGLTLNLPFAVLVKLGQDYLPTRPGTAAGVTLGLAVSVGGLLAPLLGLVADAHGPRGALAVLCVVPPIALGLGLFLPEPGQREVEAARPEAEAAAGDEAAPEPGTARR